MTRSRGQEHGLHGDRDRRGDREPTSAALRALGGLVDQMQAIGVHEGEAREVQDDVLPLAVKTPQNQLHVGRH